MGDAKRGNQSKIDPRTGQVVGTFNGNDSWTYYFYSIQAWGKPELPLVFSFSQRGINWGLIFRKDMTVASANGVMDLGPYGLLSTPPLGKTYVDHKLVQSSEADCIERIDDKIGKLIWRAPYLKRAVIGGRWAGSCAEVYVDQWIDYLAAVSGHRIGRRILTARERSRMISPDSKTSIRTEGTVVVVETREL